MAPPRHVDDNLYVGDVIVGLLTSSRRGEPLMRVGLRNLLFTWTWCWAEKPLASQEAARSTWAALTLAVGSTISVSPAPRAMLSSGALALRPRGGVESSRVCWFRKNLYPGGGGQSRWRGRSQMIARLVSTIKSSRGGVTSR